VTALQVVDHRLVGPVGPVIARIDAHPSWYGAAMKAGKPGGVVAHYTATGPGTARSMARRRVQPYNATLKASISSWHLTIDTDGSIVQMVPFDRIAWHAGSSTAKPVPGLGPANNTCLGIELVSIDGRWFSVAQHDAACAVWRALRLAYGIAREHAMITHASIDPGRRSDPGPVWMGQHAERVLDFAYAAYAA
jgi:N-acetyl-anhydromuramyl-L-alanine amidase AmpD